jgi:hypothetical protein
VERAPHWGYSLSKVRANSWVKVMEVKEGRTFQTEGN